MFFAKDRTNAMHKIDKPLLILKIDIGDGKQSQIQIIKADKESVSQAANDFIKKNGLNSKMLFEPLMNYINDALKTKISGNENSFNICSKT